MPPEAVLELEAHRDAGRVEILEETEVPHPPPHMGSPRAEWHDVQIACLGALLSYVDAEFRYLRQVSSAAWVNDACASEGAPEEAGHWVVELGGRSVECDVMWLSTGGVIELEAYPLLRQFKEKVPIKMAGGLPVLKEDLSWGDGERISAGLTPILAGSAIHIVGSWSRL